MSIISELNKALHRSGTLVPLKEADFAYFDRAFRRPRAREEMHRLCDELDALIAGLDLGERTHDVFRQISRLVERFQTKMSLSSHDTQTHARSALGGSSRQLPTEAPEGALSLFAVRAASSR